MLLAFVVPRVLERFGVHSRRAEAAEAPDAWLVDDRVASCSKRSSEPVDGEVRFGCGGSSHRG